MTPLIFNLGPTELIIILVIVLLLFGGSRLAGLGKSSGRALKEFKEETKGLREESKTAPGQVAGASQVVPPPVGNGQPPIATTHPQQPYSSAPGQSPYEQGPQTPYQQGPQQTPYQPYPQAPGQPNDPAAPDTLR